MPDRMTLAVPIFGVDPHAHAADGTPRPINRAALQRIADEMTRKMQDTGWRAAVTTGNTSLPGDKQPQVVGHVERVWVEGDRLLADVAWSEQYADQAPVRRCMTPELWTDRKTGKQWIDPVVAHVTREEIRRGLSWIQDSPTVTPEIQCPQETTPTQEATT
jgi:hypothetical protein